MGGSSDEADGALLGEFFVKTKASSSSNKGVEGPKTIREIVTSTVPNPKVFAERYQVINRTFKDVIQKASLTKETSDRAVEGLSALMDEVSQMLDGECDEHFQWEF
jgi:hypothetical protein